MDLSLKLPNSIELNNDLIYFRFDIYLALLESCDKMIEIHVSIK